MKSLYRRQSLLTAGMILIFFALLRTAFIGLSYQYIVRKTRDSTERNIDYMVDLTTKVRVEGIDVRSMACQLYVVNVAHTANTFALVTETDEGLVLCSDGATIQSGLEGGYPPQSITSQPQEEGSYSGTTTLGGLSPEKRFVASTPIMVRTVNPTTGQTEQIMISVACVATETSDITELWQVFISTFFFTATVVLCVAFITSSIISLRLINPPREIARTACKFGHSEHEVRVWGYEKRKDEMGELAEVFNAVTDSITKNEVRRSEFVANIPHEFKTPMTTITGFSDGTLDGTVPSGKERAALRTISSETRRLSHLVRRVLDLSHLQSAEDVTTREQFDVSKAMLRVLMNLENKINARHLDMDTQLPDGLVLVRGDPGAITQVCYNLLDDIIKFSTERSTMGLSITVKGGKTHVAMRNHGSAILPDELAMIFDRFHKNDKSRSVDRGGVGLGLYTVKTILNSHKKSIFITSQDDVTKSVFTLIPA